MDTTTGIGTVPAPTHKTNEFFAYEKECKAALAPLLAGLIDMAEAAGWSRRTVASTLMFLAAQQVSSPPAAVEAKSTEIEPEHTGTEDIEIEIAASDLTDDGAKSDAGAPQPQT